MPISAHNNGTNRRVLCLLQKPYDLINATEYVAAHCPEAEIHAIVIGTHANAVAVQEICQQRRIPLTRVADPDLYAYCAAYLNTKRHWPRALILSIKAALLPLAYFYWFFSFGRLAFKARQQQYDLVLLDAWRTKCLYVAAMPRGAFLVLMDGGFSTLHYGLCPAFESGGAVALIRRALHKQRPLMPAVLRHLAIRRATDATPFFTCYHDQISADCRYPVLSNSYANCRLLLGEKRVRPSVMILGIPLLKHIDAYIQRALDAQEAAGLPRDAAAIEYRFHPTDRNRAKLDAAYGSMIECGVRERRLYFSYPKYSLEVDFLEQEEIPAIIVAYPSSSIRWIEEVLGSSVQIVPMVER
ncbi:MULTISPECIES: hypothetical protein [Sphingomonadales]|uniref:Uncharacterized protein n=1 Tax=Sphingopyxis terrae subsp. ummariensis TaxID=429001 RepID=A0A1Y6FUZ3_9SPHN|nr:MULTISPECIES: hypothetical protein [Sphingomonadaceae]SMQ79483.1 hypothetical protein SAMN06295984_3382 [Sphingopyxis terrae subsp. ummariensis]